MDPHKMPSLVKDIHTHLKKLSVVQKKIVIVLNRTWLSASSFHTSVDAFPITKCVTWTFQKPTCLCFNLYKHDNACFINYMR